MLTRYSVQTSTKACIFFSGNIKSSGYTYALGEKGDGRGNIGTRIHVGEPHAPWKMQTR